MLAEKTDMGRVAGPSLLRLVDDALSLSCSAVNRTSPEIWDYLEQTLEVGVRQISGYNRCTRLEKFLILSPCCFYRKDLLSLQNLIDLAAILC